MKDHGEIEDCPEGIFTHNIGSKKPPKMPNHHNKQKAHVSCENAVSALEKQHALLNLTASHSVDQLTTPWRTRNKPAAWELENLVFSLHLCLKHRQKGRKNVCFPFSSSDPLKDQARQMLAEAPSPRVTLECTHTCFQPAGLGWLPFHSPQFPCSVACVRERTNPKQSRDLE